MQIKQRHRDIIQNYLDHSFYKNMIIVDEDIINFFNYESTGKAINTPHFKNLLTGKAGFDLYIKMLYEDVFYFWANHAGWAIPIIYDLQDDDINPIKRAAIENIFKNIESRGIIHIMDSLTEFTQVQKGRWIQERLSKQIS